jgi:hypothetical protein
MDVSPGIPGYPGAPGAYCRRMADISEQLAAAEAELAATADAHRIALAANDLGAWRKTWPAYSGAVIEITRLRQLAAAGCAAAAGPGDR